MIDPEVIARGKAAAQQWAAAPAAQQRNNVPPAAGRSASIQWASTIRPKRQVWLWENKIPIATPSALAGRGGTGKTTYACHMIARLSRGQLPGQYYGQPRPSLIWSGEDSWETVLVPRLIAAGADLNMVGRLSIASSLDGGEVTPRLPLDTQAVSEAVSASGAVLVLLDPIASTMSGDLHREADVRIAVDALARVADDTGAVMMFVRHFGKGGGNASDKMSGSHAFRDAVRSVFLFAEDGDRVVVTQDKGNYAPRGEESFAFRLENITVPTEDGPTDVARVAELGTSEVSVGDVINRIHHDDDDAGERTAAEHWLEDYLTENGATPSKVIKTEARKEGISEATLKRAKKKLGVLDRSEGFPRTSTWDLPSQLTDEPTVPTREPTEPTEPTGRDQQKRHEPTEADSQSAHAPVSEPTDEPTDGGTVPTPPTPLTARRQELSQRRTIRVKGKEVPRCLVCGKAVMAGQGDTHLGCLSKQEAVS
ncbi:AAA family ATPase [Mycolicibacterium baixiangningiae]|uniref:AAA family ATPase n=1 Tax=Mycolicibacterium baixiangningiae TaxID=2761578 RepID=UPI001D02B2B4|nr:AAA family ATPase [Mycolicibacterium baixiangningiae]